eukprot:scaffold935_cov334-Prasinococcus_capsulatus_cf.AAC.6
MLPVCFGSPAVASSTVVTPLLLLAARAPFSILTSATLRNGGPTSTPAPTPSSVATLCVRCFLHCRVASLAVADPSVVVGRPSITSLGTEGLLHPSAPIELRSSSGHCTPRARKSRRA